MITDVSIKNFGPLTNLAWNNLSSINLIIGSNGSGKTFILKALYCAMRMLEEYKRGDVNRTAAEILAEKLYWTFQPDKIGDLVTKGADAQLDFRLSFGAVRHQDFHLLGGALGGKLDRSLRAIDHAAINRGSHVECGKRHNNQAVLADDGAEHFKFPLFLFRGLVTGRDFDLNDRTEE